MICSRYSYESLEILQPLQLQADSREIIQGSDGFVNVYTLYNMVSSLVFLIWNYKWFTRKFRCNYFVNNLGSNKIEIH